MGLVNTNFSDEQLKKATEIVNADLEKIKQDFKEQLGRLELFIKEEVGPIPRIDEFVNWFFDKKKFNQTGQSLPEIKDEEIIKYVKEYKERLKTYIHSEENDTFLKLNYGSKNSKVIEILYTNLNPEKIEVSFSDFEKIFNESSIDKKIRWKATETEFVNLFTQIKFENLNVYTALSQYFLNKNGKSFSPKQLSVSKSKSTEVEYKGKSFIGEIISQIKNLQKG